MFRKLARFGDLRLKTSSCWRKTRPRLHVGRTSNSERSTSRSRISNAIMACVWRIADFPRISAIRHTQLVRTDAFAALERAPL